MVFRDQRLVCRECGKTFFFTVTEQRRLAEQVGAENIEVPQLCPACQRLASPPPPARPERVEHVGRTEPVQPIERVKRPEQVEPKEPVTRREHPERRERPERAEYVEEARASESATPIVEVDDFPLEEAGIELKLIGEVKWFNRNKGYGFVTMADGEEVFFHRSDVAGGQLAQIKDGIQVEFQVRRTDKGLEAFNVSVLPSR